MKHDYEIDCYRVLFRPLGDVEWDMFYFGTEEEAYIWFSIYKKMGCECKMLKISTLVE